jgi:hypothetical protein
MTNIGGGRALRVCDLCGGVDDHPRHSIAGTIPGLSVYPAPSDVVVNRVLDLAPVAERARLLRDLQDTSTTDRHLDCCREAGCPLPADDPSNCANRTAGAHDARGAELLEHLADQTMEG